jgi:hypothetical protein
LIANVELRDTIRQFEATTEELTRIIASTKPGDT